jgi:hypothetical protein
LLLYRKGLTTADVIRDGLERCEQRSLLVCHADGLVVAEVIDEFGGRRCLWAGAQGLDKMKR